MCKVLRIALLVTKTMEVVCSASQYRTNVSFPLKMMVVEINALTNSYHAILAIAIMVLMGAISM